MRIILASALAWHNAGKTAAPSAASTQHTQVILDELNEAVQLLKELKDWVEHGNLHAGIYSRSDEFLERHKGAPY